MSDQLREDKSFFLEAVQMNGEVLAWATNSVLGDREVALAAVQQTPQVGEKAGFFSRKETYFARHPLFSLYSTLGLQDYYNQMSWRQGHRYCCHRARRSHAAARVRLPYFAFINARTKRIVPLFDNEPIFERPWLKTYVHAKGCPLSEQTRKSYSSQRGRTPKRSSSPRKICEAIRISSSQPWMRAVAQL